MKLPLSSQERTGHLPLLLRDLVERLRASKSVDAKHPESKAAHEHGRLRRTQGYSAPMIVEESRMLQVSIFQILQNNLVPRGFQPCAGGRDDHSRRSGLAALPGHANLYYGTGASRCRVIGNWLSE